MPQPPSPTSRSLDERREDTIQALTRHFSLDHLSVEELEQRIDRALAAPDGVALDALVRDLPALPSGASVSVPRPGAVGPPAERAFVLAILGSASRGGSWVPPRQLRTLAVMGGAELDFRQAVFAAPVVEVEVFALMGGVEVIVPPGVRVEAHGLGIMGGFDDRSPDPASDPASPLVRVKGLALMGGVSVEVRRAGESRREARRSRRRHRRDGRGR